jgi:hypothetical protein
MKKQIYLSVLILCFVTVAVYAQNTFPANGSVGIGTTAPHTSALLEVASTTKGMLAPRMTQAQRNAILSPATGLLIYQTNANPGFYYYTGIGWSTLKSNSVRGLNSNLFIGNAAGASNTTGTGNIALGNMTLNLNTDRIENIAIGDSASYAIGNNAIGNQAWYNTAIGSKSQRSSTTGTKNTSVGAYSLYKCIACNDNVAVGYRALYSNLYSHFNIAVGENSLTLATGGWNTALGYESGSSITNSEECTFVGWQANQTQVGQYINSTALGANSRITASAQVRIGSSGVTSIGGFANYTNVSDGRYKKNILSDVPGLAFINKLNPVTYNLDVTSISKFLNENETTEASKALIKAKEQIRYSGFIAQDVEQSANELNYDFSGVDKPQNETSLYGLRYAEFTVPLVKAVQELSAQNDKQAQQIKTLEATNAQLQKELKEIHSMLSQIDASKKSKTSVTLKEEVMHVVPNPATNNFVINIDNLEKETVIKITDAQGKLIRHIEQATATNEINTANWARGTYFISLTSGGFEIETKTVVLK